MNDDVVIDLASLRWKAEQVLRRLLPGGGMILLIVILLWAATGIYIVRPDEVGVVKRFGAFARITQPGPHYHLPFPVESVLKPQVTKVHRVEIGFRTIQVGPPATYRSIREESLMLTGDENIVAVEFILQYRIKDPVDFLFQIRHPEQTIRAVAESVMREIIGKNRIDEVLTVGKSKIQQDVLDLLQSLLDSYKAGVQIVAVQLQDVKPPDQVIAAFKDVASAREDRERAINQAQGYRSDILPKAKGEVAQVVNQAQAYATGRIRRAEGDADRFLTTLVEYQKAKEIIRKRIYIETLEEVLPHVEKIIIERKIGERALPFFPLMGERRGKEEKR